MKIRFTVAVILLLSVFHTCQSFGQKSGKSKTTDAKNKTLIVFFDGLRPDYITDTLMPNLYRFKKTASQGKHHHSVFPTVTRVNAASYSTGSYPARHGILGNTVYFPQVYPGKTIGTTHAELNKIASSISGPLLTAVSLGEILQKAGEKMIVFSSGTTGQAFLQNPKISGGAIINPDLILPESFKNQVIAELGPVTEQTYGDQNRHKWITDALLRYGLVPKGPLVSTVWFSDPDGAAHSHGIGSKEAAEALRFVDAQFGRILIDLKTKGLLSKYNIIISTDHGFVTHAGKLNLTNFLIDEGLKISNESDDVVVAEGAVYVKDHNEESIKKIVAALHKQDWVGAVFTRSKNKNDLTGVIDGTLSFETIHYDHPRAGDILVSVNWNNEKNDKGYAGTDYATGVAGHGGASPYEINIALMARGPDFKENYITTSPTSNVDIAPTILSIYNLPVPPEMDGRSVIELLKKTKNSGQLQKKEIIETEVNYDWGTYKLSIERSVLGNHRYINHTIVERRRTN